MPNKEFKKYITPELERVFRKLTSPVKIQDFLDRLRKNFEELGDTCSSPAVVLKRGSAHCIEGALFGAAAMMYHGQKPLLMDLKATSNDFDHVILLFRQNGFWGAISKTNHAVLRFREPVYKNTRELAMSYFHEYFLNDGKKTLRSYSRPFSIAAYDESWITENDDLWAIAEDLDKSKHFDIVPRGFRLRRANKIEIQAGKLAEWKKRN